MKKVIAIALVTLTLGASLASCGKFECDACHQESSGKPHSITYMGKKMEICDDCNAEYQEVIAAYGSLMG